jgi:hypothetical protein
MVVCFEFHFFDILSYFSLLSRESTGGLVLYLHRKDRLQSERQSHTGERERRCGFIIWRIIDRQ